MSSYNCGSFNNFLRSIKNGISKFLQVKHEIYVKSKSSDKYFSICYIFILTSVDSHLFPTKTIGISPQIFLKSFFHILTLQRVSLADKSNIIIAQLASK